MLAQSRVMNAPLQMFKDQEPVASLNYNNCCPNGQILVGHLCINVECRFIAAEVEDLPLKWEPWFMVHCCRKGRTESVRLEPLMACNFRIATTTLKPDPCAEGSSCSQIQFEIRTKA